MKKTLFFFLLFSLSLHLTTSAPTNDYVVDEIVNFYKAGVQGIHASVHYKGSDEYYKKPTSPMIHRLNTTITFDSDNELTILIDDATKPRFRLADKFPYAYTKSSGPIKKPEYDVKIERNPFSIAVVRTSSGETVFNTSQFDFIYSDLFLSYGTKLPSKFLYGLGERRRDFLYDSGLYSIWNKDMYAQIDNGQGGQQTYGCHPMYMIRESKTGFWDVVYLRNSGAMDFKYDANAQTLQYFLTSSVIELKFFFGNTRPDYALELYHNYINGWTIMPFWSHGFHQSKYGVLYLGDLSEIVNNFTQFQVPIDVIWSDIDYMYSFTDFTVDDDRYNIKKFNELVKKIHWVPIVDAGVSLNESSEAYTLGKKYDVWLKSGNNNTNPLVGVVWPGVVHFVDFTAKNANKYWTEMLTKMYKIVPFSGIWLDMNENANFCSGEYNISCFFLKNYLPNAPFPDGNSKIPDGDQDPTLPPSKWAWLNDSSLPYVPAGGSLNDKSVSINAIHSDGSIELDMHNLAGFLETYATYQTLQTLNGKRPFILTRSSHVGSGRFAAHWSGDNYATWDFLRLSIPCIFNFQLFGMPMTGDDICGFGGNTTVELCARWMQLGSFYPFMRNHMAIETIDQYPFSLGETVLQASKASLKLRYSILKYYYSLFVFNRGVGTVFKPLFFEFIDDDKLLSLDTQFLLGWGMMVAAVVQEGKTKLDVYFPGGVRWYDFANGDLVFDLVGKKAATKTVDVPLTGTLPVYLRGGAVIPVQNVERVLATKDLDSTLNLVIALNANGDDYDIASGQIMGIANYSSDGSLDKCTGNGDCEINVGVTNTLQKDGKVHISVYFKAAQPQTILEKGIYVANITLYGVRTRGSSTLNTVVCNANSKFEIIQPAVASYIWDGKTCREANGGIQMVEEPELINMEKMKEDSMRIVYHKHTHHHHISE